MFNFEKLDVWNRTRKFVNYIYDVTDLFPKEEKFGLAQHIRKSAISVLSNISESTSRFSNKDFMRFNQIAMGSLFETVGQLIIAFDRKFLSKEKLDILYKEAEIIAKMLSKFYKSRGE